MGSLTQVAGFTSIKVHGTWISFNATAGTTYRIAIAGIGKEASVATLSIVPGITPLTDVTMLEDHVEPIDFTLGQLGWMNTTIPVTLTVTPSDIFPTGSITIGGSSEARSLWPQLPAHAHGTVNLAISAIVDGMAVSESFVLNVLPVNDRPNFIPGPSLNVMTTAGRQSYANWAQYLSPGTINESGQQFGFEVTTTNDAIFEELPAIDAAGTLTFKPYTYSMGGSVHVTVTLKDNGGTAHGGKDTAVAIFSITITVPPIIGTTLTLNTAGTISIFQGFNLLGSTANTWTDNSTVPGWYTQIMMAIRPTPS